MGDEDDLHVTAKSCDWLLLLEAHSVFIDCKLSHNKKSKFFKKCLKMVEMLLKIVEMVKIKE